jgi:hypothetical protein
MKAMKRLPMFMGKMGVFAVTAVFLIAISRALFPVLSEDYVFVPLEEARLVEGGSPVGESANEPGGGSVTSPSILPNVPYIIQERTGTVNLVIPPLEGEDLESYQVIQESRNMMYCGIASALMVREKAAVGEKNKFNY